MNTILHILNRFKIGQKLALVVVLFLLPLGLTSYFLIAEKSLKIDFARAELDGTAYLRPCARLLEHVAQRRALVRRGSGRESERFTDVEALVERDLREIEAVDRRLGAALDTDVASLQRAGAVRAAPLRMRQTWDQARAASGERADALLTRLLEDVRKLIEHVGNQSKLILDPDLDTYYVMDALLLRAPDLVLGLGRLGAVLEPVLARGTMSHAERAQIAREVAILRDRLEALDADARTAINEAPNFSEHAGLGAALGGPLAEVKARTRDVLEAADRAVSEETTTLTSAAFAEDVSNASDSMARYWQVLLDEEDTMLRIRLDGDLGRRRQAFTWISIAVLLSFALTALVIRSITVPIASAAAIAEQLARGDLPDKVEVGDARDETADLLRAINSMLQFLDLRKTMTTLREAGKLLESAVANLQMQSVEQSQAVTRQAAALQETQVTSQEIKQTSRLAAEKAASVLQTAERAEAVSRSGEDAITKTITGLTDIRRQVDDIAQKIGELNQRATQIGTITQTVKDLADQSNMLALNAAIEAVRSGEHGKGFGVVAREIRSLADQSIQSTNRVNEILESVTESLRGAVSIAETGRQRMETGIVEVRGSGESLRELSGIVRESSQGVRQIAAAVSQQDAGISQIFLAVSDQSKLMDETVRRLDDARAAATLVEDVAKRVTDVVGRFNV